MGVDTKPTPIGCRLAVYLAPLIASSGRDERFVWGVAFRWSYRSDAFLFRQRYCAYLTRWPGQQQPSLFVGATASSRGLNPLNVNRLRATQLVVG